VIIDSQTGLTRKVIDSLYVEAMVLADEARSYFDRISREERDHLDPVLRVSFSCESLKVTTRLMHIIAWLLTHRAVASGEMDPIAALSPNLRLNAMVQSDKAMVPQLPQEAISLIEASNDLYDRVKRIDAKLVTSEEELQKTGHARALMSRLESAF
jgi:regulator of CtrA degradation